MSRAGANRSNAATLIGALLLAATGCSSPATRAPGCQKDSACPADQACVASVCLPRQAPTGTWSVELVPPSDAPAAVTQLNGVTFDGSAAAWIARPKIVVTGGLAGDTMLSGSSHVIATLPAIIPGPPTNNSKASGLPAPRTCRRSSCSRSRTPRSAPAPRSTCARRRPMIESKRPSRCRRIWPPRCG